MGLCASHESKESRLIEALMRGHESDEKKKVKLLLLGGGQCGKSTFFKQIKVIYGKPYTAKEIESFTRIAYSNARTMLDTLMLEGIMGLGIKVDSEVRFAMDKLAEIYDTSNINSQISGLMRKIWSSKSGQEAWQRRAEFQIDDSCEYWMENLPRLEEDGYVASKEDIMRTRVRTTGIIEDEYIVNGVNFVIIDVGGQRNERSKWLHCFDDVTAIIFMCAISGYNQVLFEDETTNRLMESLMLFQKLANSPFFRDTDMILFLNKLDLFQEKIKNIDIRNEEKGWFDGSQTYVSQGRTTCWPPAYTGGCDEDAARQYIKQLFQDVMPLSDAGGKDQKKIYAYETIATHSDNIQKAFDACKDIILQKNVDDSGF